MALTMQQALSAAKVALRFQLLFDNSTWGGNGRRKTVFQPGAAKDYTQYLYSIDQLDVSTESDDIFTFTASQLQVTLSNPVVPPIGQGGNGFWDGDPSNPSDPLYDLRPVDNIGIQVLCSVMVDDGVWSTYYPIFTGFVDDCQTDQLTGQCVMIAYGDARRLTEEDAAGVVNGDTLYYQMALTKSVKLLASQRDKWAPEYGNNIGCEVRGSGVVTDHTSPYYGLAFFDLAKLDPTKVPGPPGFYTPWSYDPSNQHPDGELSGYCLVMTTGTMGSQGAYVIQASEASLTTNPYLYTRVYFPAGSNPASDGIRAGSGPGLGDLGVITGYCFPYLIGQDSQGRGIDETVGFDIEQNSRVYTRDGRRDISVYGRPPEDGTFPYTTAQAHDGSQLWVSTEDPNGPTPLYSTVYTVSDSTGLYTRIGTIPHCCRMIVVYQGTPTFLCWDDPSGASILTTLYAYQYSSGSFVLRTSQANWFPGGVGLVPMLQSAFGAGYYQYVGAFGCFRVQDVEFVYPINTVQIGSNTALLGSQYSVTATLGVSGYYAPTQGPWFFGGGMLTTFSSLDPHDPTNPPWLRWRDGSSYLLLQAGAGTFLNQYVLLWVRNSATRTTWELWALNLSTMALNGPLSSITGQVQPPSVMSWDGSNTVYIGYNLVNYFAFPDIQNWQYHTVLYQTPLHGGSVTQVWQFSDVANGYFTFARIMGLSGPSDSLDPGNGVAGLSVWEFLGNSGGAPIQGALYFLAMRTYKSDFWTNPTNGFQLLGSAGNMVDVPAFGQTPWIGMVMKNNGQSDDGLTFFVQFGTTQLWVLNDSLTTLPLVQRIGVISDAKSRPILTPIVAEDQGLLSPMSFSPETSWRLFGTTCGDIPGLLAPSGGLDPGSCFMFQYATWAVPRVQLGDWTGYKRYAAIGKVAEVNNSISFFDGLGVYHFKGRPFATDPVDVTLVDDTTVANVQRAKAVDDYYTSVTATPHVITKQVPKVTYTTVNTDFQGQPLNGKSYNGAINVVQLSNDNITLRLVCTYGNASGNNASGTDPTGTGNPASMAGVQFAIWVDTANPMAGKPGINNGSSQPPGGYPVDQNGNPNWWEPLTSSNPLTSYPLGINVLLAPTGIKNSDGSTAAVGFSVGDTITITCEGLKADSSTQVQVSSYNAGAVSNNRGQVMSLDNSLIPASWVRDVCSLYVKVYGYSSSGFLIPRLVTVVDKFWPFYLPIQTWLMTSQRAGLGAMRGISKSVSHDFTNMQTTVVVREWPQTNPALGNGMPQLLPYLPPAGSAPTPPVVAGSGMPAGQQGDQG